MSAGKLSGANIYLIVASCDDVSRLAVLPSNGAAIGYLGKLGYNWLHLSSESQALRPKHQAEAELGIYRALTVLRAAVYNTLCKQTITQGIRFIFTVYVFTVRIPCEHRLHFRGMSWLLLARQFTPRKRSLCSQGTVCTTT